MKKQYVGLDVLRGLGIFSVIVLHTAFYYFDGIYDLDLSDPPLIITIIGFILMFAGLFAMISGFVHSLQTYRKITEKKYTLKRTLQYSFAAGMFVLLIAYLYFIFTGPGIIMFDTRSMDQSIFVELIKEGRLILPSLERLLYIDSLVMIGMNIILLGVISYFAYKLLLNNRHRALYYYIFGIVILLISIARIPLYTTYLSARDDSNYPIILLLNWFVNKNNPIFPFLSFALFGAWLSMLIIEGDRLKTRLYVVCSGVVFIVVGLVIYLTAEETMLERNIDYTWFGIMVFQIGLFKLLILGFLRLYDYPKKAKSLNLISRFLYRFGIAGLTVFFVEQLFSSSLKQILLLINPNLFLDIPISIVLGFILAIIYGLFLIFWQTKQFKYGIEYFYGSWMNRFGGSEKTEKLEK